MQKIIDCSIETLDQLYDFIKDIDEQTYQSYSRPLFDSTIGQHLRHILDIYQAIKRNIDMSIVDYDIRARGSVLESDKASAMSSIESIRLWLQSLTADDLNRSISISTEMSITEKFSATFKSSVGRELFFASNHTVHHLALMTTLAKVLGSTVNKPFGIAPATASYMRGLAHKQPSCA